MKARILSIETTLLKKGIYVTIDTVLDVYRYGEEENTITFLQVFDIHTENINKKVKQKLVTDTTLSKYKVTRGYICRYLKTELKKDDILMREVSPSFVENLFIYLLSFMSNNTAVQKMKQVKSVMRFAVEEGYIRVSPFKIILKKEKKEVVPLTILNFNLFCNDNVCFRIFAWSATLSTSLS